MLNIMSTDAMRAQQSCVLKGKMVSVLKSIMHILSVNSSIVFLCKTNGIFNLKSQKLRKKENGEHNLFCIIKCQRLLTLVSKYTQLLKWLKILLYTDTLVYSNTLGILPLPYV